MYMKYIITTLNYVCGTSHHFCNLLAVVLQAKPLFIFKISENTMSLFVCTSHSLCETYFQVINYMRNISSLNIWNIPSLCLMIYETYNITISHYTCETWHHYVTQHRWNMPSLCYIIHVKHDVTMSHYTCETWHHCVKLYMWNMASLCHIVHVKQTSLCHIILVKHIIKSHCASGTHHHCVT